MTPTDPEGVPNSPAATRSSTGESGPVTGRMRRDTLFGDGGPIRRFLSRWAFALFVVFIAIVGRDVLLPFVFASLIAFILAPIVAWMSERKDRTRRMPRGLAVIICYIVFIAAATGFMLLLVPRLTSDIAKLGKQIVGDKDHPGLYKRINEEYTPELARWLEQRFPSLAPVKTTSEDPSIVADVPLPPGTAVTVTPLPDGSLAVQIPPNGVDIKPTPDGGYHVQAVEARPEPVTLEDKLRAYVAKSLTGLQSRINDVVRFGQTVVTAFIKGIFGFFFTLMIGAFLLIDLDKVHAFLRSLFPSNVREDYDVIKVGIDRGLSGVIRGQLLIMVINAGFTYIGLLIFGIKYSLILAMVAGIMSPIPIFGSILSSVPIVIVALASGEQGVDIFSGVVILLWIIGIHLVEANILNPKIIGTAAKIHPVLVIFALFLGEYSYGLVGALLAVPLLSAIQVIFMYFYTKRWKDPRSQTGPIPALPPTGS